MCKTLFKRGDAVKFNNGDIGVVYNAEKSENDLGVYLIGVHNKDERSVSYIEMTDAEMIENGFSKVGEAKYVR